MYHAEIIKVSELDFSGNIEIVYTVYVDDVETYPNLIYSGSPDNMENAIKSVMSDLKTKAEQVEKIKVGDIIKL